MIAWLYPLLDLMPVALLGAVLGLDVVSFPQAMISRPLVAATLAGAFLGHPGSGLLVGVVLELIALETLPFGASRYPEWGSAAVVGGSLKAMTPDDAPGALAVAVLGALATAWVSGYSMVIVRRINARWARPRLSSLEDGNARTVVGLQIAGMTLDLIRGGLVTGIALLLLRPFAQAAVGLWSIDAALSRAATVAVAATVAAGAAWKLFRLTPGARWYALGGVVTGFMILLLR